MTQGTFVSLEQVTDMIRAIWDNHQKYVDDHGVPPADQSTLYIVGQPGVGKTSIIRQFIKEMTEKLGEPVGFKDVRLATVEPVDLRGILVPNEKTRIAEWYPPSNLPNAEDAEYGVLFVDELNKAIPMNHNAIANLLYDREIGEYKLPPRWVIVTAGNNMADKAGDQKLPTHLRNRLVAVNAKPDTDEWLKWAASANIHRAVTGYIQDVPGRLQDFDPKRPASPTCRAWQFVSDIMYMELDQHIERAMIEGAIGEEAMVEFVQTLETQRNLPHAEDVFNNPTKAAVPTDKSDCFAMAALLGRYVKTRDEKAFQIKNSLIYLDRFKGKEYGVEFITEAFKNHKELRKNQDIRDWMKKHKIDPMDL